MRIFISFYTLRGKIQIEKELTEQKLNFFTVISHELRTPLTLIHAPLENILSTRRTDEQMWNDISIASKNSKRLIKLVNQLLDFRALQHGKVPVKEKTLPLSDLMNSMIDNFSNIARQKNIKLIFNTNCHSDQIITDRDKIETILFNLISNAMKYTPEEKSVTIDISQVDNIVFCKVSDEGVGMTNEVLENIYKPFYATGIDVSDLQASSGIGLSIVKDYCDLLQIPIEVESSPGQGTTFTLQLKAIEKTNDSVVIKPNLTISGGELSHQIVSETDKRKRILIVEDNIEMREYLTSKLQDTYSIICARDGEEGLEFAQHANPDLIITDILMPKKSGDEFVAEFRSDIRTSHIPIIVISAIDNEETKEKIRSERARKLQRFIFGST
jgi:CheY-like chemotaxis protein/two-component sensor histidine kinase